MIGDGERADDAVAEWYRGLAERVRESYAEGRSPELCTKCGHEVAAHDRLMLVNTPSGWWPARWPPQDEDRRNCKDGCECQEFQRRR